MLPSYLRTAHRNKNGHPESSKTRKHQDFVLDLLLPQVLRNARQPSWLFFSPPYLSLRRSSSQDRAFPHPGFTMTRLTYMSLPFFLNFLGLDVSQKSCQPPAYSHVYAVAWLPKEEVLTSFAVCHGLDEQAILSW